MAEDRPLARGDGWPPISFSCPERIWNPCLSHVLSFRGNGWQVTAVLLCRGAPPRPPQRRESRGIIKPSWF